MKNKGLIKDFPMMSSIIIHYGVRKKTHVLASLLAFYLPACLALFFISLYGKSVVTVTVVIVAWVFAELLWVMTDKSAGSEDLFQSVSVALLVIQWALVASILAFVGGLLFAMSISGAILFSAKMTAVVITIAAIAVIAKLALAKLNN